MADINNRIIKAADQKNVDYPTVIEMQFNKNSSDTEVKVLADGDEDQIKNLIFLFQNKLKDRTQDTEKKAIGAVKIKIENERQRRLDTNGDGWLDTEEIKHWKMRNNI